MNVHTKYNKKRVLFWVITLFVVSTILNQLTGTLVQKHVLNLISLLVIPLGMSFYPDKDIKLAAKIAMAPWVLFLILYYIFAAFNFFQ